MLEVGESIGWNHGEAQVYAARWQGRPAVLKRHFKRHKYTRELHGYHTWPGLLPPLLHTDAERLEFVIARVEGECALTLPPTEAMYRAAGAALRQMHDAAPLCLPFDDGRADLRRLAESFIVRVAGLLDAEQVAMVAAMMDRLLASPFPPPVLRHGDYTARNWLWNGTRLRVIDTEHARPGPAVLDIAKLDNKVLWASPELRLAFQEGYGREWSAEEGHLLRVIRQFDALALAVWCHEHQDQEGFEQMRAALTRLLNPAR
jgi:thiamine kinase-like enzyme